MKNSVKNSKERESREELYGLRTRKALKKNSLNECYIKSRSRTLLGMLGAKSDIIVGATEAEIELQTISKLHKGNHNDSHHRN